MRHWFPSKKRAPLRGARDVTAPPYPNGETAAPRALLNGGPVFANRAGVVPAECYSREMQVPIIGTSPTSIPPQTRLNVAAMVDETIATARGLGLRITRLKLQMPLDSNDVVYPLVIEGLEGKGCKLVAVNEMAVPTPQGVLALVSIMFRMPAIPNLS